MQHFVLFYMFQNGKSSSFDTRASAIEHASLNLRNLSHLASFSSIDVLVVVLLLSRINTPKK